MSRQGEEIKVLDREEALLIERGLKYGTPAPGHPAALDNLECAERLMMVYREYSDRRPKPLGHDFAIFQALTKIARMATGVFHEDNYLDGKNYLELARVAGCPAKTADTP